MQQTATRKKMTEYEIAGSPQTRQLSRRHSN